MMATVSTQYGYLCSFVTWLDRIKSREQISVHHRCDFLTDCDMEAVAESHPFISSMHLHTMQACIRSAGQRACTSCSCIVCQQCMCVSLRVHCFRLSCIHMQGLSQWSQQRQHCMGIALHLTTYAFQTCHLYMKLHKRCHACSALTKSPSQRSISTSSGTSAVVLAVQ